MIKLPCLGVAVTLSLILAVKTLAGEVPSSYVAEPKVYLVLAFDDPYEKLKGFEQIKRLNFRKRSQWRKDLIAKRFTDFYANSGIEPIVLQEISSPSLTKILRQQSTLGLYYMGHMRVAFAEKRDDLPLLTPHVIEDHRGNNLAAVFTGPIHPNVRWIALLGCNSQFILDQQGLASLAQASWPKAVSNPELSWYGYPKLMERPKHVLKEALVASQQALPRATPLADLSKLEQHQAEASGLTIHRHCPSPCEGVEVYVGEQYRTSFAAAEGGDETQQLSFLLPEGAGLDVLGGSKIRIELADKTLLSLPGQRELGTYDVHLDSAPKVIWQLKREQGQEGELSPAFGLKEGQLFYRPRLLP